MHQLMFPRWQCLVWHELISLSAHVKLQTARWKLLHQDGECWWNSSSFYKCAQRFVSHYVNHKVDPVASCCCTAFSDHAAVTVFFFLYNTADLLTLNYVDFLVFQSLSDRCKWWTCLIIWCLCSVVNLSPIHNQVSLLLKRQFTKE